MAVAVGIIGCIGYIVALIVIGGNIRQSTQKRATLPDSKPERSHVNERKN